jgi:hypothetical protein
MKPVNLYKHIIVFVWENMFELSPFTHILLPDVQQL